MLMHGLSDATLPSHQRMGWNSRAEAPTYNGLTLQRSALKHTVLPCTT